MLDFRLLAISNCTHSHAATEEESVARTVSHFQTLVDAGLRAYQLREKSWSDRARYNAAHGLSAFQECKLLVNDRPDIARFTNAAGIHLPDSGWPINEARRIYPHGLVGKSCHSSASAQEAERLGADYILFGPIFETESKKQFGTPHGLASLHEVCASISISVFAVGGITPQRAEQCRSVGAHGVAVIGALSDIVTIPNVIRDFESALGGL